MSLNHCLRTWHFPVQSRMHYSNLPLATTIQPRGMCLMTIEFLTRFPSSECVVTTPSLPFWDIIFDLFPKTLFHVFSSELEDPPRPNVIRHNLRFEVDIAGRFGARGAPYNLLFTVEDMETQKNIYMSGCPGAALLWVTQPVDEYIDGELIYPLYSSRQSGLCGLIPVTGRPRFISYNGYYAAMLQFHELTRYPGSAYDTSMEEMILTAYVQAVSGLGDAGSAALLLQVTKSWLPRLENVDTLFWEPPPPAVEQCSPTDALKKPTELEALLLAVFRE